MFLIAAIARTGGFCYNKAMNYKGESGYELRERPDQDICG